MPDQEAIEKKALELFYAQYPKELERVKENHPYKVVNINDLTERTSGSFKRLASHVLTEQHKAELRARIEEHKILSSLIQNQDGKGMVRRYDELQAELAELKEGEDGSKDSL